MKFEKIINENLERAYATNLISSDNKDYIAYASESRVNESGLAVAYSLDDLKHKEVLWDNIGGCMQISKHPKNPNVFFAIQNFYLKQDPSLARIVKGEKIDGKWQITILAQLPLVHRFGFIEDNDDLYIIACTVAKQKDNKDDWSKPGEIWYTKLRSDYKLDFKLLFTGLYKNHGFYQYDYRSLFIGCDSGVYQITIVDQKPNIQKILDGQIGEVSLIDLDNDGKLELLTIEPFHGNQINLYHLDKNNTYQKVWSYDSEIDFAHALCAGKINQQECFVIGIRKAKGEAFVLTYENDEYIINYIDHNVGPANITIINHKGNDYIALANHTSNHCALYKVTK